MLSAGQEWRWVLGAVLMGTALVFLPFDLRKSGEMRRMAVPQVRWGVGDDGVGYDLRDVESPLIFALPTGEGYSEVLEEMRVEAALSFARSVERERFLKGAVDFADEYVESPSQMDGSHMLGSLAEPGYQVEWGEKRSGRLLVSEGLGERIKMGEVVWPEVTMAGAWRLRAEIEVSERGRVQHLFVEKPLKDGALNQELVRFLYGLTFEPGAVELGWVEFSFLGEG